MDPSDSRLVSELYVQGRSVNVWPNCSLWSSSYERALRQGLETLLRSLWRCARALLLGETTASLSVMRLVIPCLAPAGTVGSFVSFRRGAGIG